MTEVMGGGTVWKTFSSVGKHAEICVCFRSTGVITFSILLFLAIFRQKNLTSFKLPTLDFSWKTHGISTQRIFPKAKAPTAPPGVPCGTFDGFRRLRWHDATTQGKRSVPSSGERFCHWPWLQLYIMGSLRNRWFQNWGVFMLFVTYFHEKMGCTSTSVVFFLAKSERFVEKRQHSWK